MNSLNLLKVPTNCFGYVGRVHPKPLCVLFSDTKGIQWADTDAILLIPENSNLPYGKFQLLPYPLSTGKLSANTMVFD